MLITYDRVLSVGKQLINDAAMALAKGFTIAQ
jgi:hypothetical protein